MTYMFPQRAGLLQLECMKLFVFCPFSVLRPSDRPHAAALSSGKLLPGGAETCFDGA